MKAIKLIKEGARWNKKTYNGFVFLDGDKVQIDDNDRWSEFVWVEYIKDVIIREELIPSNKKLFLDVLDLCRQAGRRETPWFIWRLYSKYCGGEKSNFRHLSIDEYNKLEKDKYKMTLDELIDYLAVTQNSNGEMNLRVKTLFNSDDNQ